MRKSSDLLRSYDEGLAYYRLLADRANKRLKALESQGLTKGTAYKSGMRAAAAYSTGKAHKYFSTANPKNSRALRSMINAVQGFLEDVTSTPSGYRTVAWKVSATTQKRYGLYIDPENLRDFYESELWKNTDKQYGSETAVKIFASIQKTKGNITNTLKSLGAKKVKLAASEKDYVRGLVGEIKEAGEWQTATDDEIDIINAMFGN